MTIIKSIPGGARVLLAAFLLIVPTILSPARQSAQDRQQRAKVELIRLKIRVVLIDKDLNQKPVPKFRLSLRRSGDSSMAEGIIVQTGLDGLGEVELQAGRYNLSTPQPIEFQGQRYSWEMEVTVSGSRKDIELTNDNARTTKLVLDKTNRVMDELSASFARLKNSVVTVWSEFGHGTGFIIDADGLVMTNQHVIGPSEYIAVQFDEKRKIPAIVLAADPEKDLAVLWTNLAVLPDVTIAPIARTDGNEPPVVEGERVFTIGSPLNQRKVITTGIVSKIERRAIISDININHGNSGGPLFNSLGAVVGITTFGDFTRKGGPGISGIVRIEQALSLLAHARAMMAEMQKPPPILLPVDPLDPFPLNAIKASLLQEKFNADHYFFGMGDYDVMLITPILYYRATRGSEIRAVREKEKRTKNKEGAVKGTFRPLEDFKDWEAYVGEYKPVIIIRATPRLGESFWRALGRGLAANSRTIIQAKLRFKADFYRMKLKCGDKEIQPIHPAKIAHVLDVNNAFVDVTDATYEGLYTYTADAISPDCGQVKLEIYSEKDPNKATVKVLDTKTVMRVAADLIPYRRAISGSSEQDSSLNSVVYNPPAHNNLSVGDSMKAAFDRMVMNAKTASESASHPTTPSQGTVKESKSEPKAEGQATLKEIAPTPSEGMNNRIGQETTVDFGQADSFLFAKTLTDHLARSKAERTGNISEYERLRKSGKLVQVNNHSRIRIINSAKDTDGADVFEVQVISTGKIVWVESRFLK